MKLHSSKHISWNLIPNRCMIHMDGLPSTLVNNVNSNVYERIFWFHYENILHGCKYVLNPLRRLRAHKRVIDKYDNYQRWIITIEVKALIIMTSFHGNVSKKGIKALIPNKASLLQTINGNLQKLANHLRVFGICKSKWL
jgi:hypothetical protein